MAPETATQTGRMEQQPNVDDAAEEERRLDHQPTIDDEDAVHHYDEQDTGVEWATPDYIWKPLAWALGGYDMDTASGAESNPIADICLTVEDDGLATLWEGDVWCNPPYGRKPNPRWAEKAYHESLRDEVDTITMLVPASLSTNWWHDYYAHADYFCFIDHRVEFDSPEDDENDDNSATFASVLVCFGEFPTEFLVHLHGLGHVVESFDALKEIADAGSVFVPEGVDNE